MALSISWLLQIAVAYLVLYGVAKLSARVYRAYRKEYLDIKQQRSIVRTAYVINLIANRSMGAIEILSFFFAAYTLWNVALLIADLA